MYNKNNKWQTWTSTGTTWVEPKKDVMIKECTELEDSIDDILSRMSYAKLVKLPDGVFLIYNFASTSLEEYVTHLVEPDILREMLLVGLITTANEFLSEEEYNVQLALGTAAYMGEYIMTPKGYSRKLDGVYRVHKNNYRSLEPDKSWTSTSLSQWTNLKWGNFGSFA